MNGGGMLEAAVTRSDVASYVSALFLVYTALILARILLSWIPRLPYNPALRAVVDFIHQVTDPYLNVFRRFLPPVGGSGFALDLSPILALIVLFIARGLIVGAIEG